MKITKMTPHLTMCLMGFSYIASSSVIAPILSIYVKDVIKASVDMIGLVTAMFFVVSAIAKIVLGVFAGGKKTISFLLFAFLIFSVCPLLYPVTNSIHLLIILRIVQGLAYASIGTASLILAGLTISSVERDKGMGAYTASLSLGFLAGPAITTFSIPLFGVQNTFYFAGLMGFIGVYAAFILNREIFSIEEKWQIIGVTVKREALSDKISEVINNKMFSMAFMGNFAFYLLFGVLLAYAPLYAKDIHFSDGLVSLVFLLYYIATTVTRFSVGKIVGHIKKPLIVIICVLSAALLSFGLALSTTKIAFASVFALIGAVQGILFPVGSMLIAEHVQPTRNVLANSLYMMGIDIGQGIAPLITAGVIAQYGLHYSFIVSATISATTTLLLTLLYIRKTPSKA